MNTMRSAVQFLIFLAILAFCRTSFGQEIPDVKIQEMKAYLYYNQDSRGNDAGGALSENIIDNDDFVLWNVIIAEGSATSPSGNTLVVVEIVSDSTVFNANGSVRLTAVNDDKKIVFSQDQSFYILGSGAKYYAPFMLYDTGCETLSLKAELIVEEKVVSEKTGVLSFACGE